MRANQTLGPTINRRLITAILWIVLTTFPAVGTTDGLSDLSISGRVCSRISTGAPVLSKTENQGSKTQTSLPEAVNRFHKTLKFQLEEYQVSPAEIDAFVESFPTENRTWVQTFLLNLTQWGNPDKMGLVLKRIHDIAGPTGRLVSFSPADIATALAYLDRKAFASSQKSLSLRTPRTIKKGDVVILCPQMRSYMETHPEFVEKLITDKNPIIVLEGFDLGLTWANSTIGMNSLKPVIQEMLDHLEKGVDLDYYTSETSQILKKMGLSAWLRSKHQKLFRRIKSISARDAVINSVQGSFRQEILNQLNHYIPSMDDIYARLSRINYFSSTLPKEDRPVANAHILNHLTDFMRFAHHRSMQAIILGIGLQIEKATQAWGVLPENIEFLVPKSGKSYSMINFFRTELGILPSAKVVSRLSENNTGVTRAIVVLDDVAGSGQSLSEVISEIELGANDRLIVGSLFSTEQGNSVVKASLEKKATASTHWFSGQTLRGKASSMYYKARGGNTQVWLRTALGKGFFDADTAVAFPYMAPDNNVPLFAAFFADLLAPGLSTKMAEDWDEDQVGPLPK